MQGRDLIKVRNDGDARDEAERGDGALEAGSTPMCAHCSGMPSPSSADAVGASPGTPSHLAMTFAAGLVDQRK